MSDSVVPSAGPSAAVLTYFVDGMDCANCVQKVERMVDRLPGAQEVRASFNRQTLEVSLDEAQTPRTELEKGLRSLGYVPTLQVPAVLTADHAGHDHAGHVHEVLPAGTPWYAGKQGRLVILSGVLLVLAWGLGFAAPQYAVYGYVAATLLGVWPLLKQAVASARLGDPFSINMLVSLAAVGAVLIGQAAEGAVVVFFFAIGELLEGVAAGRARAGIQALAALTPKTALLVEAGGTREVPARALQMGQTVEVRPGGRVPADGIIVAGSSGLDDSPVTGESIPVDKSVGDSVFAGSINTHGLLRIQVNREASDNTIARIIHLVEEAEGSKAATARFIDRFSRLYTPGVVLVSGLVAVVPPLLFGAEWYPWLYRGITLLLIGCPCALVLSVPAAITSAISAGTRRGLLIKGGAALETIGTVKTVAFDKTGTLTGGQPHVTDVLGVGLERQEVLRLAAAVEGGSSHPLARAVVNAASDLGLLLPTVTDAGAAAGRGVTGMVEGRRLFISSPQHAAGTVALPGDLQHQVTDLEEEGKTAVVLHTQDAVLGVLAIRDEPREDARSAIARLNAMGIHTVMLTGDNARTGRAIASGLGLEVQAGLLPEDKLRVIAELKRRGGVAMVGDGINDAPALAQADVGIAMGGGTDVALETADAALLRDRAADVADLVQLSRDTMTNIRWNIAFALGLKAIFLVTTLLGYTNLWMAVLADTGATALVTANALRLLGWRGQDSGVAPPARTSLASRRGRPA
ncbi:heavy metal translocating P-type ATPase [Deinococcus aerophilus]|uniref:ATPase n=1 Tax=Deinococcus aerophilus TaxID=522488 RepID=A0ABQ2GK94_9DEIO|nr:heavy metal translocating P-type ATPase [Deinococcus aerophilus]GGL99471.1 ATPase [Deinococcus aerophilus]